MHDQNHQIEPNANLRAIREAQKLTQTEFAELMGVPLRTYQELESGRAETRPVHINALKWGLYQRRLDDKERKEGRPTRDQLQANAEIWAAFYRDGKTLGEISEQFGTSLYMLSPWLTAPIIRAAYGSSEKWPKPDYKWYSGTNDENLELGPFDTREEAVTEFRGGFGDDVSGFAVEAAKVPIHIAHYLPSISSLMRKVGENFSEGSECNEDGDCPIDLTEEQERSLYAAIKAAVDKWQLDNKYLPTGWVFTHTRVQDDIEPLVNETLPGDSAGDVES